MPPIQGFFQRHPELTQDAVSYHRQGKSYAVIAHTLSEQANEPVSADAVRWFFRKRQYNDIPDESVTVEQVNRLSDILMNMQEAAPEAIADPENNPILLMPSRLDDARNGLPKEIERRVRLEQDRQRFRAEQRVIQRIVREAASRRNLEELIQHELARLPVPEVRSAYQPEQEPDQEEVRLIAVISDTQIGLIVDEKEVGARWKYNTDMFIERLKRFETEIIKTKQQTIASGRIVTGLHIFMVGDIVENHQMRDKQRQTTDRPVTEQWKLATKLFTEMLIALGQEFPEIFVDVLEGNHGRIGRPGNEKSYANWDHLVGYSLEEFTRYNMPHVHVRSWTQPTALVKLKNKTFLLNHGDSIKAPADTPQAAISNRVKRWIANYPEEHIDYVILGHFHNPTSWFINGGTEIIVNGAFFSGTDFSVNELGLSTPASQWIFVFGDDGILDRRNVLLETPQERSIEYEVRREW